MVQDGAPQVDIMKKFGYGTSTQLKVAYVNALIQAGQVPGIKGGKASDGKGKKEKSRVLLIKNALWVRW